LAAYGLPSEVAFDHDYALNYLRCFRHFCMFSEYGLLDHCIPQMQPSQFLAAVRAVHPQLRIVLLCGGAQVSQAKSEEGIHAVLETPLSPDELHRTIQSIAEIVVEDVPSEVPRP
jgi:DNA-binding NtrC family response regulator